MPSMLLLVSKMLLREFLSEEFSPLRIKVNEVCLFPDDLQVIYFRVLRKKVLQLKHRSLDMLVLLSSSSSSFTIAIARRGTFQRVCHLRSNATST
ncbi:hypothetical protein M0802_000686 [Mischocyttarus mexicanus]|nr:hypothetical protein M0802_000686 [Mischocyttarus mexicanus]